MEGTDNNSNQKPENGGRNEPPANGEPGYTRVEVERMETVSGRMRPAMQIQPLPAPPYLSTWICLILAWVFLGSAAPMTIFIGLPLDLAALVLALTCITRGGLLTGLSVLFLGTAGSLFVYAVGLFRFLSAYLS